MPGSLDWLIDRLHLLGALEAPKDEIEAENEREAFCFGINQTIQQAILTNNIPTLNTLLEFIYNIPLDKFTETIKAIEKERLSIIEEVKKTVGKPRKLTQEEMKEIENYQFSINHIDKNLKLLNETIDDLINMGKFRSWRNKELELETIEILFEIFTRKKIDDKLAEFSKEERIRLDAPALFESMEQAQRIWDDLKNSFLDKSKPSWSANSQSHLMLSKELEQAGGICDLCHFSKTYTENELIGFLNNVKTTVQKSNNKHPTLITLNTLNKSTAHHAVTITYDSTLDRWMYVDTKTSSLNELTKYFSDKETPELAKAIFSSLPSDKNKTILPVTVTVSTTKNEESKLQPFINTLIEQESSNGTSIEDEKIEVTNVRAWLPYGQDWFMIRGRLLGILSPQPEDNEADGFCFGIQQMAKQAIHTKRLDDFDKRFELINAIPLDKFVETINKIKEDRLLLIQEVKDSVGPFRKLTDAEMSEFKKEEIENILKKLNSTMDDLIKEKKLKKENRDQEFEKRKDQLLFNAYLQKKIDDRWSLLPEDERIKLEIPIFFEDIEIYQNTLKHKDLFPGDVNITGHYDKLTFPLVISKELEEAGSLCIIGNFSMAYTEEELTDSLNDLKDRLLQSNYNETMSFDITSQADKDYHAVTIGYDPTLGKWSYIDANRLPSKSISTSNTHELAKAIFNSYAFFNGAQTIRPISMNISVKKNTENEIRPIVEKWETDEFSKMTPLTKEKSASLADGSWLYLAVINGQAETVKLLLANGANPDLAGKNGITPLVNAVVSQNIELIKLLLDNKANPDLAGKDGITPLVNVVVSQNIELIKLLLDNKANPNLADKDGTTPLDNAVRSQNIEMAKLLLANGANPNLASKDGLTPLDNAVRTQNIELIKLLLDNKANPDLAGNDGVTPLDNAVRSQNIEMVKLLLANGATPNLASKDGYTPLISAVLHALASNDTKIIKLLLSYGANPNLSRKNDTPAGLAIEYRNEGIKNLLDAAKTLAAKKFIDAVRANDHKTVKVLLNNGIDPNIIIKNNTTLLQVAVKHGNAKIVALSLNAKIKPNLNAQDNDGATALYKAVQRGDVEILGLLLESGANPDIADNNGVTPLFIAAQNSRAAIVSLLLQNSGKKADPNVADKYGHTPFFIAAQNGHTLVVKLLLANGADISIKHKVSIESLRKIAREHKPNRVPEMEAFINAKNKKANTTNTFNFFGNSDLVPITPLEIAKVMGHTNIVKLISDKNAPQKQPTTVRPSVGKKAGVGRR